MYLKTKKYKGFDVVRLTFGVAPLFFIFLVFLMMLQAVIPTTFMALSMAFFVDTAVAIFSNEMMVSSIYLPLSLVIVLVTLSNVIVSLPEIISLKIKLALEKKFTPALLERIASLEYKHIENAQTMELIERVDGEFIETMQDGIGSYAALASTIISIVSVLGLIILQVWWAAIVLLVSSIPLFLISVWAGKKNYEAAVEADKYERRYKYYSNDVLTSREAVEERMLFGYTDEINKRYAAKFYIAQKNQLKVLLEMFVVMCSSSVAMIFIASSVAFILVNPMINGDISFGNFMGIITAVFALTRVVGTSLQDTAESISASNEYMKDLTTFVELSQTKGATDLPSNDILDFKTLEFKNVSFKYPNGDKNIFTNLSFKIYKGKHYAFVGTNGAGKSTIIKLATGLYSDYGGEILINGKELRKYQLHEIKSLFSIIHQDFAHYQISLADNIALGYLSQNITEKEINHIANKVGLDETIKDLKNGINTQLGKISADGVDISGGQWQKISIARSLTSKSPLKILDEPTSALDPIMESKVYKEFEGLVKGKTAIFISHRLGSTKLSDEIFVLDNGKVVEKGSHKVLMKLKGRYSEMFESQRMWYVG